MRISTWSAFALATILVLGPRVARASVSGASVTVPICYTSTGAMRTNCTDTGFHETSLVGATSEFIGSPTVAGSSAPATFTSAFDAWNEANGDDWTLVDGATVDVSIDPHFGLDADDELGGLNPVLFTLSGGSPQLLSTLVWTQALVVNYTPLLGALPQPIETLDTFELSQNADDDNPYFPATCVPASSGASPEGGAFCGPIYPFQYGSTLENDTIDGISLGVDFFFDSPEGNWPDGRSDGITLLSSVDEATHTLTVYQGVAYGFTLTVPEPPAWVLMLIALPGLLLVRRWPPRRQAAAA